MPATLLAVIVMPMPDPHSSTARSAWPRVTFRHAGME